MNFLNKSYHPFQNVLFQKSFLLKLSLSLVDSLPYIESKMEPKIQYKSLRLTRLINRTPKLNSCNFKMTANGVRAGFDSTQLMPMQRGANKRARRVLPPQQKVSTAMMMSWMHMKNVSPHELIICNKIFIIMFCLCVCLSSKAL